MVKGLYTAYSGLTVQQKRLDVVSNNLANATTTGYKKEGLTTCLLYTSDAADEL